MRGIRTDDNAVRALVTTGLQLHTRSTRAYLPDSVRYFRALCTDGRRAAYLLRNKYEGRKRVERLPLQQRTNGTVIGPK